MLCQFQVYSKGNNLCCAVLSHSVVSNSLEHHGLQPARPLYPWGFSRQEYQSGLPCPPPRDLPNPGVKSKYPTLQADSLPAELSGKPKSFIHEHTSSHFQVIFPCRLLQNIEQSFLTSFLREKKKKKKKKNQTRNILNSKLIFFRLMQKLSSL